MPGGTEMHTVLPVGGWAKVFDRSPIAMGIATGYRFTQANVAMGELLGLLPAQIIGRDSRDFLAPEVRAQIPDATEATLRGDRRVRLEGALLRPDGELRWVTVHAVIVGEEDGLLTTAIQATDLTDLHEARTRLGASERRFRSLLTNISDTVSLTDADGKVLFSTGRESRALGYPVAVWDDLQALGLVHPDDAERGSASWQEALDRPGVEVSDEVRMRSASGSWVDVAVTGVNLLDDPDVGGIVVTTRNITAIRRAERLSTSQAAVLELIARGAPLDDIFERCVELVEDNGMGGRSSIYLLDEGRLEMRAGRAPAALNDFVRASARVPAESVCDLSVASGKPAVVHDISRSAELPALAVQAGELGLRAAWSHPILTSGTGEVIGTLSTIYEKVHTPDRHERQVAEVAANLVSIAVERVANEERLAHQALHDGLTGLPNRTLLLDRLDHALERRGRVGGDIAVLFCDLDRFKVVNDSMGHGVGDEILVAVAERLVASVEPGDTVARFGGDEFVVLLEDVRDEAAPVQAAERIATALEAPFVLPAGQEVFLTASTGVAIASDHVSGDGWLRDADAAMYRAKERGRNRLELFDTEMRDAAMVRMQVENDLRRAVDRGELVVHYQPIVDLASGRISGAEALVRWQHPVRGLLPPGDFIEVAEETGAIDAIGRHVLDQAVGDISELVRRTGVGRFELGVNVSARQLSSPGLVEQVDEVCRRHGWAPQDLLLEITESALTGDIDGPIEVLNRIHDLGARLAIDDFGTGHSSLTRLGRMPVDQVKIDRSFVAAVDEPLDRVVRLIEAVVAVAGALDLQISGEGVESPAQLDHLRQVRCHLAQGYYFAKPLPLDEFADLLVSDPRW